MINDSFLLGFLEKSQYKMHPEFSFKFLHWFQKLSLKTVRLQLGVLRYLSLINAVNLKLCFINSVYFIETPSVSCHQYF